MIERLKPVAEEISFLRDYYPIATSVFIHSRQSSVNVRLPPINHVPQVFRVIDLAQVPDVVVEAVAIDMVYLHRRKPPVVPSPNDVVHLNKITFSRDTKMHIQITIFAIPLCALFATHQAVRFGVHEQSAAVVVVIILLDASRQCGQLAIRQINSIHTLNI